MKLLFAIIAIALTGCISTPEQITGGTATGIQLAKDSIVGKDLVSAAYNADKAVEVGALAPNDPAPKCLHSVLVQAGLEAAPGAAPAASFEPKNDGVASLGVTTYIIVQQAKKFVPVEVSAECKEFIGTIVIDGARAVRKTATSLLPGILK